MAAPNGVGPFSRQYFDRLAAGKDHWWVRGMQAAAEAILAERRAALRVLDAGCGTGACYPLARKLSAGGVVWAIDVSWAALLRCRGLTSIDLVQASVTRVPFGSDSFDLVLCMDVLQHLTEAEAADALSEMRRVLAPGGRLLARTGAAWGRKRVPERKDWRLYTPERLARSVADAGLKVTRLTYANALPALWAAIVGRIAGRRTVPEHGGPEAAVLGLGLPAPAPPWHDKLLGGVLALEARRLTRPGGRLPFGHSLFVLAEKPAT